MLITYFPTSMMWRRMDAFVGILVALLSLCVCVDCNNNAQCDCSSSTECLNGCKESCQTNVNGVEDANIGEKDAGVHASNMNVYIESAGPPGGVMCVKCWSGNHDKDTCACVPVGRTERLYWSFTAGSTTKYWCEASYGKSRWDRTAKLTKFAVFGDGVPKKSSDWKVNASGKIRYQEDGKPVDDFSAPWTGIKP